MKSTDYKQDFVPETGLAKSRMKQYLETASTNGSSNGHSPNMNPTSPNGQTSTENGEDLPKGIAKSLLAKWKSMENVKETSPEPNHQNTAHQNHRNSISKNNNRATSRERQSSPNETNGTQDEHLPQTGTARSLLNKWQNLDSNTSSQRDRRAPRPITPPPPEELEKFRVHSIF